MLWEFKGLCDGNDESLNKENVWSFSHESNKSQKAKQIYQIII